MVLWVKLLSKKQAWHTRNKRWTREAWQNTNPFKLNAVDINSQVFINWILLEQDSFYRLYICLSRALKISNRLLG